MILAENEVRIFRNRKNGTSAKIRHKSEVVNEIIRGSGREMNRHPGKKEERFEVRHCLQPEALVV